VLEASDAADAAGVTGFAYPPFALTSLTPQALQNLAESRLSALHASQVMPIAQFQLTMRLSRFRRRL
jgi:hypothetical protein